VHQRLNSVSARLFGQISDLTFNGPGVVTILYAGLFCLEIYCPYMMSFDRARVSVGLQFDTRLRI